ncbi:MAG TPA: nickel pincer cofactor biosynthesis protein LarC [Dehalococcoidia bacterium]|nr:nickel pincer cofactor biosynthesis protein LarC [Dehalococcoidia bacterium]
MARAAYLDCFSGAAGDMLLAAMLDAGLAESDLRRELRRLGLPGFELQVSRVQRGGITATHVDVSVAKDQPERRLADILRIIGGSQLLPEDGERATDVFKRLTAAEAKVHGCTIEEVQLHDVGAVDAIVDVVGAVVGLRLLGVQELFCSALAVGSGQAQGPHGFLPVPAPATLELLTQAGAPLRPSAGEPPFELLTPTAAAFITTLARFERPELRLQAIGYGAGSRDTPGRPNVLRLWLGERVEPGAGMVLLETNIDDSSPELLGYAQERLLALGASDVWLTPVQMKKNRPGVVLSVMCGQELEEAAVTFLLRETSTLGVRSRPLQRWQAEREELHFQSSLGPAAVKVKRLPGEEPWVSPEYEACRVLVEQTGLPLAEVYRLVEAEARQQLDSAG